MFSADRPRHTRHGGVQPRALVLSALAVSAALVASLTWLVVAAPPAAAAVDSTQMVTVQSSSPSATTARIDLWQRDAHGLWTRVWGPAIGYVGELGIGQAREGVARTPAGIFGLTQAFGNQGNRGTRLPYFLATPSDWWDGESGTAAYNTHVHQAASPGPHSENLYSAGYVYSRAVVIDYNRFPVTAGMGSAFFLHVANGQPTAGCVSLAPDLLDQIMHWLNPAAHPLISIGVGAQATARITAANAMAAAHNPRGVLDVATAAGAGTARVAGWAFDPDNASVRLSVEVFLDRRRLAVITLGVARPDVSQVYKAYRVGPAQGFDRTLAVPAGRHELCVYADNIGIGTANPNLGCRTVSVG